MTTTPQEPTGEVKEATLESFEPIIPLRQAARDRVNQTVKLHLPDMGVGGGAIEVEGRVTRFDEDDMTVTVVDKDAEYDIPLHRIGIIEAAR